MLNGPIRRQQLQGGDTAKAACCRNYITAAWAFVFVHILLVYIRVIIRVKTAVEEKDSFEYCQYIIGINATNYFLQHLNKMY